MEMDVGVHAMGDRGMRDRIDELSDDGSRICFAFALWTPPRSGEPRTTDVSGGGVRPSLYKKSWEKICARPQLFGDNTVSIRCLHTVNLAPLQSSPNCFWRSRVRY